MLEEFISSPDGIIVLMPCCHTPWYNHAYAMLPRATMGFTMAGASNLRLRPQLKLQSQYPGRTFAQISPCHAVAGAVHPAGDLEGADPLGGVLGAPRSSGLGGRQGEPGNCPREVPLGAKLKKTGTRFLLQPIHQKGP